MLEMFVLGVMCEMDMQKVRRQGRQKASPTHYGPDRCVPGVKEHLGNFIRWKHNLCHTMAKRYLEE
jgi:hypothetical protein